MQFWGIGASCRAAEQSVVFQPISRSVPTAYTCMLLSPDKFEVAHSAFTDANSNSGLYPAAQVVSGCQLPPGESLPCLSLSELAWRAGLCWKPPAFSRQTLVGGTGVLTAWTRARSSARQWWQPPVAILRSRLALGITAAICQVLALKMY